MFNEKDVYENFQIVKNLPIVHKLSSGDQVTIITSSKQKPSEDWLNKVVTSKAKSAIKNNINRQRKNLSSQGKELIKRKFKQLKLEFDENISKVSNYFQYKSIIEFYFDIANGTFNLKRIREYLDHLQTLKDKSKNSIIEIEIDRSKVDKKTSDEKSKLIEFQWFINCKLFMPNPIPMNAFVVEAIENIVLLSTTSLVK